MSFPLARALLGPSCGHLRVMLGPYWGHIGAILWASRTISGLRKERKDEPREEKLMTVLFTGSFGSDRGFGDAIWSGRISVVSAGKAR